MPAQLKTVELDLLEAHSLFGADVILQQVNCLAVRPHGLSATISRRLKWANVYGARNGVGRMNLAMMEDRGVPGEIDIRTRPDSCTDGPRFVANLFAQYVMGKPLQYDYTKYMQQDLRNGYTIPPSDTAVQREAWFRMCLKALVQWVLKQHASAAAAAEAHILQQPVRVIALPERIGCGLAGGDWSVYKTMLQEDLVKALPDTVIIVICCQPPPPAPEPSRTVVHKLPVTQTIDTFFTTDSPTGTQLSTTTSAAAASSSVAIGPMVVAAVVSHKRKRETEADVDHGGPKQQQEDAARDPCVMMTGSRGWSADVGPLLATMVENDPTLQIASKERRVTLSHGNAQGADRACAAWAKQQGWKVRAFQPEWDRYRRMGCVQAAGNENNQRMLDESRPQFVIGFLKQRSRGTLDALTRMQEYARERDSPLIQVTIVEDDGTGRLVSRTFKKQAFKSARL